MRTWRWLTAYCRKNIHVGCGIKWHSDVLFVMQFWVVDAVHCRIMRYIYKTLLRSRREANRWCPNRFKKYLKIWLNLEIILTYHYRIYVIGVGISSECDIHNKNGTIMIFHSTLLSQSTNFKRNQRAYQVSTTTNGILLSLFEILLEFFLTTVTRMMVEKVMYISWLGGPQDNFLYCPAQANALLMGKRVQYVVRTVDGRVYKYRVGMLEICTMIDWFRNLTGKIPKMCRDQ